jgi:hypothetical protein
MLKSGSPRLERAEVYNLPDLKIIVRRMEVRTRESVNPRKLTRGAPSRGTCGPAT